MSKVTTVKDLGNRYGTLGSALVRKDRRHFVVSGTDRYGAAEWLVVPASRGGTVTSWRELCTADTREQAVARLEKWDNRCHCGADLADRDRCPRCSCELFFRDCDLEG